MPEFIIKEVRLPELRLPEIKRDEIVRALSGVRLPEVDLARARQASIKVPTVALTGSDIGRLIAAGTAVARFVRPAPSRGRLFAKAFGRRSRSPVARIARPRPSRSRRPFLIVAVVVAALAAWAALRQPAVRRRVEAAAQDVRERVATLRAQDLRPDPTSNLGRLPADGEASIEPLDLAHATDDAGTAATSGSPDEPSATTGETSAVPAFEESQTPR